MTDITGNSSSETLTGTTKSDTITSGDGNDIVYGGNGNDILDGGTGDDYLDGGNGQDILFGNEGNDTLIGMTGIDLLFGGSGDDLIGSSSTTLTNDNGTDTIYGDGYQSYLDYLNKNKTTNYGNDTITGGNGTDVIYGDSGFNDDGGGNDVINAGNGNDSVYGEGGDDVLSGESGNDIIDGGAGDDRIIGGTGADILTGGSGKDMFVFNPGDNTSTSQDTITDFVAGQDNIDVTGLLGDGEVQWGYTDPTANGIWFEVVDGNTYIHVDTDGDPSTSEAVIKVNGEHNFSNQDFTGTTNETPVNVIPTTMQSLNEDQTLIFSSGNSNAITVSDADRNTTLTVTLTATHGTLTLPIGVTGLDAISGDGTSTLVLVGAPSAINTALEGLVYTADANYNGSDTIQVKSSDGFISDVDFIDLTVNAVNDAPVNSVSVAQTTNEDTALVFSTDTGNALSVSDSTDTHEAASTDWLSTTVSVLHGTLTAVTVEGGAILTANGTANVTIEGTAEQINAALNGLRYDPTANYNGGDTLTITTNDGGYNNQAGINVLSDTQTVDITVNAVNDAPENTVSGPKMVDEDAVLIFNDLSVSDSIDTNEGGSTDWLSTTVSVLHGTLTAVTVEGGAILTANGSASVTIEGTAEQINAALNGLRYDPTANYNGGDTLTITTNDGGYNNQAGINVLSDTQTVAITVNAVNDAPILDAAKSPQLNAQNEDAGAPSGAVGTLVSALVDTNPPAGGVNNVSDVDSGALQGIALTGVNATIGTWWYSTNNGANWAQVGAVADSNALLLAADAGTRLYFQSNANWNGILTNAVTFRAWDQTSGAAGTKANASINGGTTAYSSATDTASLTINSINDAPVANSDSNGADSVIEAGYQVSGDAGAVGNVLTNDTDVDVGDSKTVVGVTVGSVSSTSGNVGSAIAGIYGTLTLGSGGAWTYTLNNNDPDTNALAQNEQPADVFTYTMRDAAGATSTSTLTIYITGTNDAPTITNASSALAGTVKEDATLTASGQLSATDADHGASQTWSIVGSSTGSYGSIGVDNTGKWSYSLSNGAANVQALNEGENRNESFIVRVTDDKGAYVDQTVNMTVQGTSDVLPLQNGSFEGGELGYLWGWGWDPAVVLQYWDYTIGGVHMLATLDPNSDQVTDGYSSMQLLPHVTDHTYYGGYTYNYMDNFLGGHYIDVQTQWGYGFAGLKQTFSVQNTSTLKFDLMDGWGARGYFIATIDGHTFATPNLETQLYNVNYDPSAIFSGPQYYTVGNTSLIDSVNFYDIERAHGNENDSITLSVTLSAGVHTIAVGAFAQDPWEDMWGQYESHSFIVDNFRIVSPSQDPIVFDLDGNGVALLSQTDAIVSFDLNADGLLDDVGWVDGNDGILVWDKNGDGRITNGREMFIDVDSDTPASCLAELAKLDANTDGLIDAQDTVFAQLQVWRDANQDGVTDGGELLNLNDLGIASIDLNASEQNQEVNGNVIQQSGTVNYADGTTTGYYEVAFDVEFATFTADNTSTAQATPTADPTTNFIEGTAGDDTLTGTDSLDVADILYGAGGNDLLSGGLGADIFAFLAGDGADTVQDFNAAEGDVLNLADFGLGSFEQLQSVSTQTDAGLTISLSATDSVTLVGATLPDLQPECFYL